MPLVINTNVSSLGAQKNLAYSNTKLTGSVQRLSSGLRVNTAKDDAAGLAVSQKLRAQIASVSVAIRNSQDGISLSQTSEGGLNEVANILTRMRELSEQSANGTLKDAERSSLNVEYEQLYQEVSRIANVTEFNGVKLLSGQGYDTGTGVVLQVGFQNTGDDRIALKFAGLDVSETLAASLSLGADINTMTGAQNNLDAIDSAIAQVSSARGILGAVMNRLESTIQNLRVTHENLSAADSAIRDADFAFEASTFIRNQILVQAGTSMVAQANMLPQVALTLLQ
ncbi:MAG: flagellin [Syntrophorhabdaceae bacterium]|nr:flagellin [Syntrophorhabdaceae bacterium]